MPAQNNLMEIKTETNDDPHKTRYNTLVNAGNEYI